MPIDRYQVWPYVKLESGEWSIPEKALQMWVWDRVKDKLDEAFYDAPMTDFAAFLRFLQRPGNHFVFILDAEKKELCFGAWLNNLSRHIAHSHFFGISPYSRGMGRTVIKYWRAMGQPLLLIGITPAWNEIAVRLALSLGYKRVGEIPRYCYRAKTNEFGGGIATYMDLKEVDYGG